MHPLRVLDAVQSSYPGDGASVEEVLALARSYAAAARRLLSTKPMPKLVARAPAHLCAVHAIELYLHAFLKHRGTIHSELRSMHHNVADMLDRAVKEGLVVDARTVEHIGRLVGKREYLVSRYAPDRLADLSHPDRILASLKAIGDHVPSAIRSHSAKPILATNPTPARPSTSAGVRAPTAAPTPPPNGGTSCSPALPPNHPASSVFTGVVLGPGGELFELKLNPLRR